MSKFTRFYFIAILFLILIANVSIFENQGIKDKEFINSTFHYNQNSKYSWPLFGYYSISSYFGKRASPTSRGINLPFRN